MITFALMKKISTLDVGSRIPNLGKYRFGIDSKWDKDLYLNYSHLVRLGIIIDTTMRKNQNA